MAVFSLISEFRSSAPGLSFQTQSSKPKSKIFGAQNFFSPAQMATVDELVSRIDSTKLVLEDKKQKYATLLERLTKACDRIRTEKAELESRTDATQIAELEAQVTKNAETIGTLEAHVTTLTESLEALVAEAGKLESDVSQARKSESEVDAEIKHLTQILIVEMAKLQDLNLEAKVLQTKLESLKAEESAEAAHKTETALSITRLGASLLSHEAWLQNLQVSNEQLNQTDAQLTEWKTKLTATLSQVETLQSGVRTTLDDLRVEREDLASLKAVADKLEDYRKSLFETDDRISRLNEEVMEQLEAEEEHHHMVAMLNARLEDHKHELVIKRHKLEELNATLGTLSPGDLKTQVDDLHAAIATSEQNLAIIIRNRQDLQNVEAELLRRSDDLSSRLTRALEVFDADNQRRMLTSQALDAAMTTATQTLDRFQKLQFEAQAQLAELQKSSLL